MAQAPEPEQETLHTHVFTVRLDSFGTWDQTRREAAMTLMSALNRAYNTTYDGAGDPLPKPYLVMAGNKIVEYDWRAADGEHSGHENVLSFRQCPHPPDEMQTLRGSLSAVCGLCNSAHPREAEGSQR